MKDKVEVSELERVWDARHRISEQFNRESEYILHRVAAKL